MYSCPSVAVPTQPSTSSRECERKETARLTEDWVELDEYQKSALNDRLQILQERLSNTPVISITYFVPDERKSGGAYCTETGIIKKIDYYNEY